MCRVLQVTRNEHLNVYQFLPLADAQAKIETSRDDYNHRRLRSSFGHPTPSELATRGRNTGTSEAAMGPVSRFLR